MCKVVSVDVMKGHKQVKLQFHHPPPPRVLYHTEKASLSTEQEAG
jgi:hypothetical protein